MTKVVLVRHARSTANAEGILAGRLPGVALDEVGRAQATALADLLRGLVVAAAYTSPLQRCRETAALAGWPAAETVDDLNECDYGSWSGRPLAQLRGLPVWKEIQESPSTVRFPGGEAMTEMSQRIVSAVERLAGQHRSDETIIVFSHGDPLKATLAAALGIGLDQFQRFHIGPAGVTAIDYSPGVALVLCVNATTGLAPLLTSVSAPIIGGGDIAK